MVIMVTMVTIPSLGVTIPKWWLLFHYALNAQESMKVSGDDIFGLFETQIHLHKDPDGGGRCH